MANPKPVPQNTVEPTIQDKRPKTIDDFMRDKRETEAQVFDLLKTFADKYPEWNLIGIEIDRVTGAAGNVIPVQCSLELEIA